MDNGTTLFVSLAIFTILGIVLNYYIIKKKAESKVTIIKDWEIFIAASSRNDISQIKKYGDKLLWNSHLSQDQLSKILEVVNQKIKKYPELKDLRKNACNKQISYNRLR